MNRIPLLGFALLFCLLSSATSQELPMLAAQFEKLAPRAGGVALVEVTNLKEIDTRPSDGPLYLEVSLKIIRSTGTTQDKINITKASGGHPAPPGIARKPARTAVKLDTFTKGEKYWLAFASHAHSLVEYHEGVLAVWREKDAPQELEAAVKADLFSHRPEYDPRNGLTYSWLPNATKTNWQIRMQKDGNQLWERTLPGEKFGGANRYSGWWVLIHLDQWSHGLEHAERTKSNWYLGAETLTTLEQDNPYQRPAEKHRVVYFLEAETGKISSVRVCPPNSADPYVIQYYQVKSGKVQREERFDFLEKGGVTVGGTAEGWLRKIVRTYEPASGKLLTEETFRHASTPEGSKYLPVNKP